MSACDRCMRLSLLQNEAAGFAENNITVPSAARKLINLEYDEMLDQMRDRSPRIEQKLDRRVKEVRGDEDYGFPVWTVCKHEDAYPDGLFALGDRPIVVYGAGVRERFEELSNAVSVALVGARRASSYGRDMAYMLGNDLSSSGVSVVSGLALGVDGAAHRGALAAGGRTIAVLAGGPERAYPPSHKQLHADVVAAGSVISERPPGSVAQKWGFPARNRLIAALSRATVVVEGTLKSGARHTAEFADQLHIWTGAVPGPATSPLSDLPNHMLFESSGIVRSSQDILSQLELEHFPEKLPGFEPDEEMPITLAEVLDCVLSGDATPHAIALRLPMLSTRDVVRALGELELMGRISRDLSGRYGKTRNRGGLG